ncbi:GDP-mannose 4,6-dehydratase [bacterium]|nr:GDP-mannose 4,6-dehydratase [bacterium]
MAKRVLVTGGAGLVGSHTAEYYAKRNYEVIILDNLMRSQLFGYDKESVEYNWNYLTRYPNIKRIKGDVREEKDVEKALGDGVDIIVHTAGQPGVPSSVRMPKEDFSINAFGTLNVLECARRICPEATFIYCSTNKVYGENVDKIPLKELEKRYVYDGMKGISEEVSIDHCGHTPYGASKFVGDIYTQEYAHIYGMKTAVFRMSCIYGTRQFGFEDQGWVAWFIIATLTDKPITIYGNGKQVRDLLYVEDLVRAYDLFVESEIKHAVYNTGGGSEKTISLLEFLDILEEELGKKPRITFSDWRPSDQKVYISDISRIKKELNWQPVTAPKEGMGRIIDWVKKNIGIFS